ncbi:MAG: hypothetical protein C1942_04070 [Prosthecochloris sp.]|nr:hypothetical protein [Prosthecochloris sp.]
MIGTFDVIGSFSGNFLQKLAGIDIRMSKQTQNRLQTILQKLWCAAVRFSFDKSLQRRVCRIQFFLSRVRMR